MAPAAPRQTFPTLHEPLLSRYAQWVAGFDDQMVRARDVVTASHKRLYECFCSSRTIFRLYKVTSSSIDTHLHNGNSVPQSAPGGVSEVLASVAAIPSREVKMAATHRFRN